jgi:hypothetical protein
MTASTQGLTAQGLAGSGIPSQQGSFSPELLPTIGADQYFGAAQQPNAGQVPPQQVQQLIQQLVGQILPVAQQMILPQVIAQAVQLVHQQTQQLITQLAVPQLTGQQPFWGPQWQPSWTTQAPGLSTTQAPGLATRPYSLFS